MLTVYVDQKDIAQLPPASSPGVCREMRIELIDVPVTAAMTRSGETLQIYTYVRYCDSGTEVRNGSSSYSFATGALTDTQGYAPMMEFLVGAYIKLSALLGTVLGDVIVRTVSGRPELLPVSGRDRPDLVCAERGDATGKARTMGRPFKDEGTDPVAEARRVLTGDNGTPSDPALAAQLMDSLARAGNAAAQTAMAVYSAVGCGVPKDFGSAAQWAGLAAQNGDADAAGVQQIVSALPTLEQKAVAGDAKAQAAAAVQYIGLARFLPGVTASVLQPALAWALKAAAQNEPAGFQALAVCYDKGIGTPPDKARAQQALQRAAAAKPGTMPATDTASSPEKRAAPTPQAARAAAASAGTAAGPKDDHTAYRKAYGQWKRAIASARERRMPKIAKALQAEQFEIEQAAKQEYEEASAPFDAELARLQENKAKADAALAATGLFQRQERKDRKDAADKAAAELEALQKELQQARSRMDTRISGAQREAYKKLPEILAVVDAEIPLPPAPENPGGFTPVPGIDNYAQLREAAFSVLSDSTRPLTIREMRMRHELIDQYPDDTYRICRDLCDEGAATGAQKNGTNTYVLSDSGRWEVEGTRANAGSAD